MTIQIETYIIPEYVACYAMYGEPSGDSEIDSAYDEWLSREVEFNGFTSMHLVSVSDDKGFMRYHELHDFGIGSCDTQDFTFHVTKES